MGLFGRHDEDAEPVIPATPPHPALATSDALASASLHDLAVAVLVAGIAPGPDKYGQINTDVVIGRVQSAVLACDPRPEARAAFDDGPLRDVILEGVQVLERSLLIRLHHSGSLDVIDVTRRGQAALAAADPGAHVDLPAGD